MSDLSRHLQAAQGYLELGMFEDASNELEAIDPEGRASPEVVAVRVAIYNVTEKWNLLEVAARHMVKVSPEEPGWWIQWAYGMRRCRSIEDANQILLDAEKLHPKDATIQFNLGCYACQQGDMEEAKRRVAAAINLDSQYRFMALDDPDLEPLWNDLAVMLGKG